jgi:hypothetical protein
VANREEIENVLPKLGRGARIKLKLKDGSEVIGTLYGVFDGFVCFEEEEIEPIDLGLVDNLLVRIQTEGPGTDPPGQ